jgi:hypothetical protein
MVDSFDKKGRTTTVVCLSALSRIAVFPKPGYAARADYLTV